MKRLLVFACLPSLALAHGGGALHPDDLWSAWRFDPGVVAAIGIAALLYVRGSRRSQHVSRAERICFWSGIAVLALALVSPLHPLGEVLFSAHMAQHEILMLAAAPLLVLSRPLSILLRGVPVAVRPIVGRWSRRAAVRPFTAWWTHALAIWAWHIPALFQATLRNELVHTAQHLSFFGSALLFWWSMLHARGRAGYGAAVFSMFTTALHTGILGALLTFAPAVIYPAYSATAPVWGLTPLEDQQIGGLIMWVPAGIVYTAAGLAALAAWLRQSDRLVESRRYAG